MYRKALIAMAFVALVGLVGAVYAAEAPGAGAAPREMTITGKVVAAPADAKYAATVDSERPARGGGEMQKVTYYVTSDEQGKKLAKDAGKTVEIKGTVERKDQERWLTVKEFKVVEAPKPAAK